MDAPDLKLPEGEDPQSVPRFTNAIAGQFSRKIWRVSRDWAVKHVHCTVFTLEPGCWQSLFHSVTSCLSLIGVGFGVGGDTGINYLVLQVHYKDVTPFLPPSEYEPITRDICHLYFHGRARTERLLSGVSTL